MWRSLLDCLLYFLNVMGAVLIYARLFLYEDEEEKFQNKIEEWWIRLSDKQIASRSRVAAFMREVARLTGIGFDRLFGRRLFGLRVIPVSIYLSVASAFLLVLLITPTGKYAAGTSRHAAFVSFLFFLALGVAPALTSNKLLRALWWSLIPLAILSVSGFLAFSFRTRGVRSTFRGIGLVALIFVSSLFCDLIYIALTRYILRRTSRVDHIHEILLMTFANLLALAVPLLGPIYAGLALSKYAPHAGAMVLFSFVFNSIDLFAGSAALFLSLLLLLHRLFWPTIQRPLYAIYRYSPIREKKWLFGVGIVLLLFPHHLNIEALKKILERL